MANSKDVGRFEAPPEAEKIWTPDFKKRDERLRKYCYRCKCGPRPSMKKLLSLLPGGPFMGILDMSCASGSNALYLQKYKKYPECIDVFPFNNVYSNVCHPCELLRSIPDWWSGTLNEYESHYIRDDWYRAVLLGNTLYYTYDIQTLVNQSLAKLSTISDSYIYLAIGSFHCTLDRDPVDIFCYFKDLDVIYREKWKDGRCLRSGAEDVILVRRGSNSYR